MTPNPETAAELALYAWLVAGALMLLVEALGIPGVGFLFAGIGAVGVGTLISGGALGEDAFVAQVCAWFVLTFLAAALLFKPLQRFRSRQREAYHSMLGTTASVVAPGLLPDSEGQARWSGTVMRARLAPGQDPAEGGAVLRVVAVEGTVIILGR